MKKNVVKKNNKKVRRGLFIVIEGLDRVGKSTQQMKLLANMRYGMRIDFPYTISYSWSLIVGSSDISIGKIA